MVRRVGTLPPSFSYSRKLPVSRPFSLSLFLFRRALSILVLSRTFLPHVLLANRQCLLARRGIAILVERISRRKPTSVPSSSLRHRRSLVDPAISPSFVFLFFSPSSNRFPYVCTPHLLGESATGNRPPKPFPVPPFSPVHADLYDARRESPI